MRASQKPKQTTTATITASKRVSQLVSVLSPVNRYRVCIRAGIKENRRNELQHIVYRSSFESSSHSHSPVALTKPNRRRPEADSECTCKPSWPCAGTWSCIGERRVSLRAVTEETAKNTICRQLQYFQTNTHPFAGATIVFLGMSMGCCLSADISTFSSLSIVHNPVIPALNTVKHTVRLTFDSVFPRPHSPFPFLVKLD